MWQYFSSWLFAEEDARSAAALRIAFCATYLLVLWDFYPAMPLLFGQRGLFGTMEPLPYSLHGWACLLYDFNSPSDLNLWFWASVAVALLGMLGFASRFSLAATFYSMLLFRERGPYMTFGADLVLNCIGILVLFSECGKVWSLDNLLSRRRLTGIVKVSNWPMKAIQVQVALIYLITGLKKIETTPWQDGSAVYYAIQVGNVFKGQSEAWILHHHAILAALTYFTLLMEISFPFLVFYSKTRWLALFSGFLLHTGIDMFMSIRFFSLAMYVGYLAFATQRDWDWLTARAKAVHRRWFAYRPTGKQQLPT